jgi:hypothetical protein
MVFRAEVRQALKPNGWFDDVRSLMLPLLLRRRAPPVSGGLPGSIKQAARRRAIMSA